MRRKWLLILAVLGMSGALAGCGQGEKSTEPAAAEEPAAEDKETQGEDGQGGEPSLDESVAKGSDTITQEKYEQVEGGLSYEEVAKLIGSEGEEDTKQKLPENTKRYTWSSDGDQGIAITVFEFVDSKLDSKSQFGFSEDEPLQIRQEQYDQLKLGMPIDQVTKLLGGEGVLTTESDGLGGEFKSQMYTYKGDGEKTYSLHFTDGILVIK
ncbi:DUF3862 domain-containing protein [Bacillus mangrovi]|uniref:DUF3862 domain-containing protein n=1 Tax=Metabacillus mangrovi TaxID=1491830 RepID=A0A7X2V678_9BACI|nr:DUF3862 domain-containing protein [Metabacillus mangrovi]MTH54961.1 DUF3862 domain-containing protein [Metabacillus mangrovi]